MHKIIAALLAEFIGTFALTFFGAGAIAMASASPDVLKNMGLAAAPGGLLTVALAHGLALFVFISGCGYISGGHFNPAVSFGLFIAKKLEAGPMLLYIAAQSAGAIVGAAALMMLIPDAAKAVKVGATLGALSTVDNSMLIIGFEAILTFALVFVVLTVAVDERGPKPMGALAIGLTVTMCILFAGPLTGASMNPARSLGPAVIGEHWTIFHAYVLGPCLGAAVAATIYRFVWKAVD